MHGFREINLNDSEWGEVRLLVLLPYEEDPWGVLGAQFADTLWGKQIAVVSGEALSHALHGWVTPLMREIGISPTARAKRVPVLCSMKDGCIGYKPTECLPGDKTPDCYIPDIGVVGSYIAMAWKEGRYVIMVEGSEFSLA